MVFSPYSLRPRWHVVIIEYRACTPGIAFRGLLWRALASLLLLQLLNEWSWTGSNLQGWHIFSDQNLPITYLLRHGAITMPILPLPESKSLLPLTFMLVKILTQAIAWVCQSLPVSLLHFMFLMCGGGWGGIRFWSNLFIYLFAFYIFTNILVNSVEKVGQTKKVGGGVWISEDISCLLFLLKWFQCSELVIVHWGMLCVWGERSHSTSRDFRPYCSVSWAWVWGAGQADKVSLLCLRQKPQTLRKNTGAIHCGAALEM